MSRKRVASPFPTARPLKPPQAVVAPRPAPGRPVRRGPAPLIGAQIKALRVAAHTSGGALAASAGISRSMLSRIERGLVSPSMETLDRIAGGLDVSVARFFADRLARSDFCHVPAGHGIAMDCIGAVAGYGYELLSHLLSSHLFVEPCIVRLADDADPDVTFQHPGVKFIYQLSGDVVYRYGLKVVPVRPGDALLFDATALHGIETIRTGPVSYLSVVFSLRD